MNNTRSKQWSIVSFQDTTYSLYMPDADTDHIQKIIKTTSRPYEEHMLQDIVERTNIGDIIIDVGANIGNHTIALAAKQRRVIAFEPNRDLATALRDSVSVNNFCSLVTVYAKACGNVDTTGQLEILDTSNLGKSRLHKGGGDIPVVALDSVLASFPVRAIKVDVEGMERDVLQGAAAIIECDRPLVYVESDDFHAFSRLVSWFANRKYVHAWTFNVTATHLFVPCERSEQLQQVDPPMSACVSGSPRSNLLEKRLNAAEQSRRSAEETLRAATSELLEARSRPLKQLRVLFSYRVLAALLTASSLIPRRTAARLSKSIAKRDPARPPVSLANRVSLSSTKNTQSALFDGANTNYSFPILKPAALDTLFAKGPIRWSVQVCSGTSISIVIPVFNAGIWLRRALNSALSQASIDVEIIVVDDGSSDDSVRIAHEIANTTKNVRVVSLLRNFGCYYARNIGMSLANGDYVTVLDSDDIMAPHRLFLQVEAIRSTPSALASRCRQRRWSSDFSEPLSQLGFGENSLLWRRELLADIGWYDSVRFAADSEFRRRLIKRYGASAITDVEDELYFLRSVSDSLSLSKNSAAYKFVGNTLEKRLSKARKIYEKEFYEWHETRSSRLFVPFPLRQRPFALGACSQNASPSLGIRCVGAMATFPARQESCRRVLDLMLPQLDEIFVYLNNYEDVPAFCKRSGVRPILASEAHGDLRDNGKFYPIGQLGECYTFTLDDDIIYPADYVRKMVHFIEMLERKCVVGVHGVDFPTEELTDLKQRSVYHFRTKQHARFVDLLGTGTAAWYGVALKPSLQDFQTTGVCDLWFARLAAVCEVPLFCVPREQNWLAMMIRSEETLFNEALEKQNAYLHLLHRELTPLLKEKKIKERKMAEMMARYEPETLLAAGFKR